MIEQRLEKTEYGDTLYFDDKTIDEAIAILQKYKDSGWTHIYEEYDAHGYNRYMVCKTHTETDDEYRFRMSVEKLRTNSRRQLYEELRKEFGES